MQRPAKPWTPVRFRPQPPFPSRRAPSADQCSVKRRLVKSTEPIPDPTTRPGGEIGRHKGLKIPRLRPCRFDSGPGHQMSSILTPASMSMAYQPDLTASARRHLVQRCRCSETVSCRCRCRCRCRHRRFAGIRCRLRQRQRTASGPLLCCTRGRRGTVQRRTAPGCGRLSLRRRSRVRTEGDDG